MGIIVPSFTFFLADSSASALLNTGALVVTGNLALRYVILKRGIYSPLAPYQEK